jgi:hypothetical protein
MHPTTAGGAYSISFAAAEFMHKLRWTLAIAGVIPFAIPTLWLLAGLGSLPLLGAPEATLASYGLVIASFLAGSQWGVHLSAPSRAGFWLALSSNLVAICLWLLHTLLSSQSLLIGLVGCFVWLVCVDFAGYKAQLLERTYLQLRATITAVVIVLLVLATVAIKL